MQIGKKVRLEALGFWGTNLKAFSQSLTSDEALRRAQKAGGLLNMRFYRPGLVDNEIAAKSEGDQSARAIGLSYQRNFPSAYNQISGQWDVLTNGQSDYVQEFAYQFDGPGMGYINHQLSTANVGVTIRSTTSTSYSGTTPVGSGGFPLLQNAGFSLDLYLPKPAANDPAPLFIARWNGHGLTKGWQLRVFKGRASVERLRTSTTGWTQAKEDSLIALLKLENPSGVQQAAADALKEEIYADSTDLDFGDWYGEVKQLDFIPEPRGVLHVICNGKTVTVNHTNLLRTRAPGIMWPNSTLTLISNGPAFFWRAGFPWFAPSGQIGFGHIACRPWGPYLNYIEFKAVQETPTGTTLALSNDVLTTVSGTPTRSEVRAKFTSTHRRYTPFLYAAQAWIPPTERDGSLAQSWDSDDHLDNAGNGPIMDAQRSEDDSGAQRWTVTVRDPSGETFDAVGWWYDTLENRVVNLYLDGEEVLHHGICKVATLREMSEAEYNQTRDQVTHPWTQAVLEICDQNAILDEHLVTEDPIGDGETLCAFNRKLLGLCGVPAAEIVLNDAVGRIMPYAVAGENWATRPGRNVALGQYIRNLNDKFGHGARLVYRDAAWRWEVWPSTVAEIRDITPNSLIRWDAAFVSDPTSTGPATYPGRLAVLAPLESVRDTQDFYGRIRVEGGEGPDGQPIVATWDIARSYSNAGGGPLDKRFIGRVREYIESDDGLRTRDDVLWVRRCLLRRYGSPPRFLGFETYFHDQLETWMVITVDGTLCRIVNIAGASANSDRMTIVARELA